MRLDRQLSENPLRQWFTLEELLTSVLADVIETDAQFQLMQGEAWRRFGSALDEFNNIPQIDSIDFSVGFGRLENLALNELDINLDIERYKPSWIKRFWWGFVEVILRIKPTQGPARFRLAHGKTSATQVTLRLKARRNREGKWEVDTDPNEKELAA